MAEQILDQVVDGVLDVDRKLSVMETVRHAQESGNNVVASTITDKLSIRAESKNGIKMVSTNGHTVVTGTGHVILYINKEKHAIDLGAGGRIKIKTATGTFDVVHNKLPEESGALWYYVGGGVIITIAGIAAFLFLRKRK
jgi:hypothetical protein